MKVDYSQKTYRISLSLRCAVLTLIGIYVAVILPAFQLLAYFITALFLIPLISEKELGTSILMFFGVYLFSLLLVPGFTSSLPYLLFFGHYGIVWYFCAKAKDKLTTFLLRLIYSNVCMVLIYLLAAEAVVDSFIASISMGWRIALAQVVFVVYSFLYGKALDFYRAFLRGPLLGE